MAAQKRKQHYWQKCFTFFNVCQHKTQLIKSLNSLNFILDITHTRHTQHTQEPVDSHTHIDLYIYITCFVLTAASFITLNDMQINKRHIHTLNTLKERQHWKGLVSMKIVIPLPTFFLNNPTYFTNHSIFMRKM